MTTLLLELLALAAGAAATELGHWTVVSDRGRDAVFDQVVELLPRAQRELEAKLGLALRGPATVVLCGSTASFRNATPGMDHRHTLGVAFPGQKTLYLNCEEIGRRPYESFSVTLRHEVSHVIVGEVERRGNRRVPLWFDEGVAVWTSGKIPLYDQGDFRRAVAAGTLPPLADLTDAFPLDPTARGIAYEQSESFVRYLVRRYGEDAIRRILRSAARGVEFDAAVQEAVGADLAGLERRWLDSIRSRWPWLSWILETVSLFGLASVFAVFAFLVYWRRRKRKYQEWEMEEGLEGDEGGPQHPW